MSSLRINVFINGDVYRPALNIVLSTRGLSFNGLLDRITAKLSPPFGAVQKLYSLAGVRIRTLPEMSSGEFYVASGNTGFKRLEYGSKRQAKPAAIGRSKTTMATTAGRVRANVGNKPKVIQVHRNRRLTAAPVRVALPKNPADWNHVLSAINDRVSLPTGAVRKLYTMAGRPVRSIDEIEMMEVYIACGSEALQKMSFESWQTANKHAPGKGSPRRKKAAPTGFKAQIASCSDIAELEGPIVALSRDGEELARLWRSLDYNGNNIVSLAEIDKFVVEQFPLLDHKPALMRAYKQTTLRDGDGDDWVERKEFPALLRNLFYFNHLWHTFDEIDQDDDRRISFDEFLHGLHFVGMQLSEAEAEAEFAALDDNGGGVVLFDEFCAWVASKKCPVNGRVVTTYTTSTDRARKKRGGAAQGPHDDSPDITVRVFDSLEKSIKAVLNDKGKLKSLWRQLDFNGNNIVSLSEIDKFTVEKLPLLNHKPALMRAYKKTTLKDGDGDDWVERFEFPALLRNLFYFNKLFVAFDGVDKDDDRRLDLGEFQSGLQRVGLSLSPAEAEQEFRVLDRNGGGVVLFDEFCAWVAERACPVNGDVVSEFTTTDSRAKPSKPTKAKQGKGNWNGKGGRAAAGPNDDTPEVVAHQFDALEKEITAQVQDSKAMRGLWKSVDYNGNGLVSLAEIDKFVVERYPLLNHKPALMRAYKHTTLKDGDGDAWVERPEFPALLFNMFYFNKLFHAFAEMDTGDDRRVDIDEFHAGLHSIGMSLTRPEAEIEFARLDVNGGGQILFDEFCAWAARRKCPVS